MEFQRIDEEQDCLACHVKIEPKLAEKPASDFVVSLERRLDTDQPALRIACDKEVLHVPLEPPCDWTDITAALSKRSNTLVVTVRLADGLRKAGDASTESPTAALAGPEHLPSSQSESDNESMHSASSQVDVAGDAARAPPTLSPPSATPEAAGPLEAAPAPVTTTPGQPAEPKASQQGGESAGDLLSGEGAGATKKKKKKKKKKSGAAAAGEGAAGEAAGHEEREEGDEGAPAVPAAEAGSPVAPSLEPPTVVEQGKGAELEILETDAAPAKSVPTPPTPPAAAAPARASAAPAPDPAGISSLGKELPRRLLSGPLVRDALSKEKAKGKKGEDQWLMRPYNTWRMEGDDAAAGEASFSAWGVFDGHGGRQAATFASNALLKNVAAALDDPLLEATGAAVAAADLPGVEGLSGEDAAEWRTQAELTRRLPAACAAAFRRCDAEARRRFAPAKDGESRGGGGTTATLALLCGWELLVANVGDSLAYLDTGAEVLAVSGNHRLSDSPSEVERIRESGGEVAPSLIDGKPAGPIRVWPGGLAMSRSIGDADAGDRVSGEPEVCQVTIPPAGARLVIASDGLWDAVHPKTAAHHTREMTAAEAAHKLLALAIKADKLKDDVTVVVVDFLPGDGGRLPPALSLHRSVGRKVAAAAEVPKLAHVWHPLREAGNALAAGAQRRREVLEAAAQSEADREALEQRQEELRAENEALAAKAAADEERKAASGMLAELSSIWLTPEDVQSMAAAEAAAAKAAELAKAQAAAAAARARAEEAAARGRAAAAATAAELAKAQAAAAPTAPASSAAEAGAEVRGADAAEHESATAAEASGQVAAAAEQRSHSRERAAAGDSRRRQQGRDGGRGRGQGSRVKQQHSRRPSADRTAKTEQFPVERKQTFAAVPPAVPHAAVPADADATRGGGGGEMRRGRATGRARERPAVQKAVRPSESEGQPIHLAAHQAARVYPAGVIPAQGGLPQRPRKPRPQQGTPAAAAAPVTKQAAAPPAPSVFPVPRGHVSSVPGGQASPAVAALPAPAAGGGGAAAGVKEGGGRGKRGRVRGAVGISGSTTQKDAFPAAPAEAAARPAAEAGADKAGVRGGPTSEHSRGGGNRGGGAEKAPRASARTPPA